MNLTPKTKNWLVVNCGIERDATDEQFSKAAAGALVSGELSAAKFAELQTTEEDEDANEFKSLLKSLAETIVELKASDVDADDADDADDMKTTDGDKDVVKKKAKESKQIQPTRLQKMITSVAGISSATGEYDDGESKEFGIRIKEAVDQYDSTKSALVYPEYNKRGQSNLQAGRPVKDYTEGGRPMYEASDRDKAISGAFAKWMVNSAKLKSRSLAFAQLPQHDRELFCYALENEEWGGSSNGSNLADIKGRLTPVQQKQLIDDATSGGLEAAPIVFDDQVIQTPLLNGELYPHVNVVPLDRGRRIEGVITGTVTGSWGGVDDTAISLFTTTSYVTAFDTTIFRWEGAIRIGLDFLSDTPMDFGAHVTGQYGERLLEDLDDVIATGNGTTQPEGIMNKSGVTSVSWGGATSLGNYESLRFGVVKPEHGAGVKASACFIGNETSYQRARAIPVGSNDARRLGGMSYDSYSWMERPYKINESMANTQVAYVIMARYRMYRRRGLAMRTSTEGDTLIRRNEMLMVAMARYGGQLERGAVAAVTTTAPA